MKAETIIKQLQKTLPRYTELFSDKLSITSLINNSGTVTATTSVEHGLSNGKYIYIKGALTPITITDIARIEDVATAHTLTPHDLTDNYQTTVTISGVDQPEYNGEHKFIHQANRKTFTFEIEEIAITPATGSNMTLLMNIASGYNGLHEITVVDEFTFTYQIESDNNNPAQGDIVLYKELRISGAISLNRLLESYTAQADKNCWLYVVLGNVSSSKDRLTTTDRTGLLLKGQDVRITMLEPFSIYLFIPTKDEISARYARDLVSDFYPLLVKSLAGLYIPSEFGDVTPYGIALLGHNFVEYDYAYYVHEFRFEYSYEIVQSDLIDTDTSVAFRNIELQFLNNNNQLIMDTKIDLDDEPLT